MRIPSRWLLTAAGVCALAASAGVAYQRGTAPSGRPAFQPMPTAEVPAEMQAVQKRVQRMMVFVDAESGEMRPAEPGEHAALTGANARASANAFTEPAAIQGPNGMWAIAPGTAQLDFSVAVVESDGSIAYRCQNPAHRHPANKGGSHVR